MRGVKRVNKYRIVYIQTSVFFYYNTANSSSSTERVLTIGSESYYYDYLFRKCDIYE